MILEKPVSVQTFEALNKRMSFNSTQKYRFQNNQSGVKGEFGFADDLALQTFSHQSIYDSEFETGLYPQLDFIVITSKVIHLYDVKNFDGIYYYENGHFRSTKKKIYSPLTQLDRAYDVLDILLQQKNIQLPIVKKLVFVSPNFTLYGNRPDLPIILPSQLNQHFNDITHSSSELQDYHYQITEYIESRKIRKKSYDTKIDYCYDSLTKGVWCGNSVSTVLTREIIQKFQ